MAEAAVLGDRVRQQVEGKMGRSYPLSKPALPVRARGSLRRAKGLQKNQVSSKAQVRCQ